MPVATSVLDNVTGKFVRNDGKTIELTNGNGEISIRQWHECPRVLPRELYIDEEKAEASDKFSTL